MSATFDFTTVDDDGVEIEHQLPAKWDACDRCDGEGKHVNPAIDGNGLSAEDFDEDPDFREDYMRGVYDVACEECRGRTTVLVPDESRMSAEQKALLNAHYEREARWARERASEERYGY